MKTTGKYILGKKGITKLEDINQLPIGTRIYKFGPYMSESIWSICGADNEMVIMTNPEYTDTNPIATLSEYTRGLSQKFGIGSYIDDIEPDFRFDKADIEKAVKRAKAHIIRKEQEKVATQEREKRIMEALPARYPHLTPNPADDVKVTKKNFIIELKRRFPDTKFNVRKDGYRTYYVYWSQTEPDHESYRDLVALFSTHKFDQTGDYYDYAPSLFNKVFGGLKYMFLQKK